MNQNKFLLAAIKRRDTQRVLQMIHVPGYDINYATKRKITPLILAAKLGIYAVTEKLIWQGADVTCCDIDGRTALHHASYHGYADIVKLVIQAGCDIHALNHDGDQALHEAVTSRSVQTVEILLDAGSDVNRPNHVTGSTPLDLAVLHDNTDVVAKLLQYSANTHHRSRARETALHYAVQVGSQSIILQLLNAGASINATNHIGETALTIAVQERSLRMVKFLMSIGCAINYNDYLSPLCIACRQNSQDIICYLLSNGYDACRDASIRRYLFLMLEKSNPELLSYVYYRCENPLSLKESCRMVIRRHLGPLVKVKLAPLRIPKILKDWVSSDIIYEY